MEAVVYGGTFDAKGTMYALDAETGQTLWTFPSGGTVVAAPAIVDGIVYWGSGYTSLGGATGRKQLYAFAPQESVVPPEPQPPRDGGLDGAATPGLDAGSGDASAPASGSWAALYQAYLGAGTVGHCVNCHGELGEPGAAYDFLEALGQIDGKASRLAGPGSVLTWLGGSMPPGGPASYPEAARDLARWAAAGAPKN